MPEVFYYALISVGVATIGLVATIVASIKEKSTFKRVITYAGIIIIVILFGFFLFAFFAPQSIPLSDVKSIKIEGNKFVDPKLEFSVEFPNFRWDIDSTWSKVNWMIFSNIFKKQAIYFTIIRIEDSRSKDISEASKDFAYDADNDGLNVIPTGNREKRYIDNVISEVVEVEVEYNKDFGYSYEYGFGKAYFFLYKDGEVIDEYQIMCLGLANTKETAKEIYIEYTSEFDYALTNFNFINDLTPNFSRVLNFVSNHL